jgi:hypothetical protein
LAGGKQLTIDAIVGSSACSPTPQDRVDLGELKAIHGDLPVEPIPGLDS